MPVYSHLVPLLLPVAKSAQAAGHEVVVATGTAGVDHVKNAGLIALELPNALGPEFLESDSGLAGLLAGDLPPLAPGAPARDITVEVMSRFFVGLAGRLAAEDLVAALSDTSPDLILRDITEYGGYYAAECLGVPHGVLDISPLGPWDHPAMLAELNHQRQLLSLPSVGDPWHALRGFRVGFIPETFYSPGHRLPTIRHYQPPETQAGVLDPAIADLPGDRPLVLATLGSNASRMIGDGSSALDTIVEVLGELPVTGVVALGAGRDPADWPDARPANVHLTSFVQQKTLLPACDAFITHGGFNGTLDAFQAGVPMVVLPLFAEQPANAARIVELGAGIQVGAQDLTPATLRSAVSEVLSNHTYRARGVQRRILALPLFADIVKALAAE